MSVALVALVLSAALMRLRAVRRAHRRSAASALYVWCD